jgi:hypothetical protein
MAKREGRRESEIFLHDVQIRVAYASATDLDQDLSWTGRRRGNLLYLGRMANANKSDGLHGVLLLFLRRVASRKLSGQLLVRTIPEVLEAPLTIVSPTFFFTAPDRDNHWPIGPIRTGGASRLSAMVGRDDVGVVGVPSLRQLEPALRVAPYTGRLRRAA